MIAGWARGAVGPSSWRVGAFNAPWAAGSAAFVVVGGVPVSADVALDWFDAFLTAVSISLALKALGVEARGAGFLHSASAVEEGEVGEAGVFHLAWQHDDDGADDFFC